MIRPPMLDGREACAGAQTVRERLGHSSPGDTRASAREGRRAELQFVRARVAERDLRVDVRPGVDRLREATNHVHAACFAGFEHAVPRLTIAPEHVPPAHRHRDGHAAQPHRPVVVQSESTSRPETCPQENRTDRDHAGKAAKL